MKAYIKISKSGVTKEELDKIMKLIKEIPGASVYWKEEKEQEN